MRNDHGIRDTTVLVDQDEIRNSLRETGLHQVLHDSVTTIQPDSIGEHKTHLLAELEESGAGVTRGSNDNLGVICSDLGVLVINVGVWVLLCFVEHKVFAYCSCVVPQFGGEGLASRKRILDALFTLEDRAFLGFV